MKFTLFILLSFLMLTSMRPECKSRKKSAKGSKVTLMLTHTTPHCGGMRPTPEMEEAARTPHPLSNANVYIRKGAKHDLSAPIVYQGKSDTTGRIALKMEPGTYALVGESKKDIEKFREIEKTYGVRTAHYEPVDMQCLKEWFATPDLVFTVNKDTSITLNFADKCHYNRIPCTRYTGPLPQ
jgi:hypothetical protein